MPRRVAIVQGHPDPSGKRFCHALADAYAEGAATSGNEITRIEMAQLDFSILHTQEEFKQGDLPEMLVEARDGIVSAQHLVVIFPLWQGTMPALLKGFLEQVMRPGVALEYRKHGFPRGLLAGRSARLVVTMGMPALIYRWYFRAHGVRGLERSILGFLWHGTRPRNPARDGRCGERCETQRWLDRMRNYGRRLI